MRWESERSIINSLNDGDRSFTDLVDSTGLSKPVLSQRLTELKKQGKIEIIPQIETKRFLYHLVPENLNAIDEVNIKVHILSKIVTSYLTGFAKDSSISDEEYVTRFGECVSILLTLRLQSYMVAPLEIQEQWLKNNLGLEFVKNMAQLFPKKRNVIKYTTKSMSSKELAIFKAKDAREALNELLEFLDSIIEKITEKNPLN